MRMPPVFSKSFYRLLTEAAEEFGVSRGSLAIRALKFYIKELRLRTSPLTDAVGEDSAKEYAKVQSKLSKDYWATVPVEERKRRAAAALEARWGKKKK
jgi:hypothetical protein